VVVIGGSVTLPFVTLFPCVGDATITITFNAVVHINTDDRGGIHATFTTTGEVVAGPVDAALPTYTGHFMMWGGFNGNLKNAAGTFTFVVIASGSDGSTVKFQLVQHFSVSASGVVLMFEKPRCF